MKRRNEKTRKHRDSQRRSDGEQHTKLASIDPRNPALLCVFGRFIVISCAVYLMLLFLWPVVGGVYSSAFLSVSHTLFHTIGDNVQVVFTRIDEQGGRDVSMQVRNLRDGMMVERHIPSRYSGYLPAALLIALTVATPLSWRRRIIALLIGLVALHIYIFSVLLLTIVRVLTRDGPAQLYELSGFWDNLLKQVIHHTTTSPTFSMLVPVVLWAAVTFRRGDLATLAGDAADRKPNPARMQTKSR